MARQCGERVSPNPDRKLTSREKNNPLENYSSLMDRSEIYPTVCVAVLVVSMQLHHSLLQLPSLIGSETEIADIVQCMLVVIIVAELSLDRVGAQEGVGDKRARQPT